MADPERDEPSDESTRLFDVTDHRGAIRLALFQRVSTRRAVYCLVRGADAIRANGVGADVFAAFKPARVPR